MRLFRRFRRAALFAVLALAAALPAAAAEPLTPEQKKAVEEVVRDYLLRNPEFLIEVLQAADEKIKAEAEARAKAAIAARKQDLLEDPTSPVGGNPKGKVTVVEFFDYRCAYCKQVAPSVEALLAENKDIRLVYKEFPILGPESVLAARAALAAHKQGKYAAFHNAMMALKGQVNDETIIRVAGSVGLDLNKLRADMVAPETEAILKRNLELAQAIEVRGTPAFVIGDTLVPGAVDLATLRRMVTEAKR